MSGKGRLKAVNRKNRFIIYLGVAALLVICVYLIVANILTPIAVPDFELQVKDCLYNPSTGSFSVSGTFGIQVPRDYYYYLAFVSITDGNKTIDVFSYHGFYNKEFSCYPLYPSPGCSPEGPDWHFYILEGITLESKNLQLTFEYKIKHRDGENYIVLERGTEVFSVNVAY